VPSFETDPYADVSPHAETLERRALALWKIAKGEGDIVVASARSLVQRTVTRNEIIGLGAQLKREEDASLEELVDKLITGGYVREEPIAGPGQFSLRGGILDVWSPDSETPARIEFFGDSVDSIRSFDPDTQLSLEQLRSTSIAPMREFAASPQDLKDWAFFAEERFSDDAFRRSLKDRTDFASEGETFTGWEFLIPLSKPLAGSLFDHLDDRILVIDEPVLIESELDQLYRNLQRRFEHLQDIGDIGLPPAELFLEVDQIRTSLSGRERIELRGLGRTASSTDEDFQGTSDQSPLFLFPTAEKAVEVEILSRSVRKFSGVVADFAAELKQGSSDRQTILATQTQGMAERLEEILREFQIVIDAGSIRVGNVSGGFELPSAGLTVYTESDIFGESIADVASSATRAQTKSRRSKLGAFHLRFS
jgi:transcription-repair coupling factor (superfamily II helicase)